MPSLSINHNVLPAMLFAGLAAFSSSCGPSASRPDSKTTSTEIRGELINPPVQTNGMVADKEATVPSVEPEPVLDGKDAVAVTAAPPTEMAKPAEPLRDADGYQTVGFDVLSSFDFQMPDDTQSTGTESARQPSKVNEQIPAGVKEFNGKKVSLKGFMLPLKVESGAVTEFLIMKDQSMCCYGTVPRINEWVSVKTVGRGVKPVMDQAVSVAGTLHVGEMRENGYLVGIYSLDAEKLQDTAGD